MRIAVLFSTIVFVVGCGRGQHSYVSSPAPGDSDKTAAELNSFPALSENIFSAKCVGCHKGKDAAADVDLSGYANILNSKGAVVAGQPDASTLFKEVKSGDMPLGGDPLTEAEVQAIGDWIAAGAPNGEFATAPPVPSYKDVQSKLFDAYCVKCHSGAKPAKGLALTSYASLMTNSGLVVAGRSQNSTVYTIIKDGKMPPKGVVIPPDVLDLLGAWIDAGAQNN